MKVRQEVTQGEPEGDAARIVDAAIHAAQAKAEELGFNVERCAVLLMLDHKGNDGLDACVGGRYRDVAPEDVPVEILGDLMGHLKAALRAQGIDMATPMFMPMAGPPQG